MVTENDKLIKLESGKLIIYVNPEIGGAIVSSFYHDKELLKSNLKATEPRESGCFVMAPFCSWLPSEGFQWNNHQYNPESNLIENKPAVHGYAWQNEMEVILKKSNCLVLKYKYSKTAQWPWGFEVEQTFLLTNDMLELTLKVSNHEKVNAPISLGLHPYFNLNQNNLVTISLQDDVLPIEKAFGNSTDECETLLNWDGELFVEKNDLSIAMRAESDTKLYLGVYRPAHANYICLEPITQQLNTPDMSDKKFGFDSVKAGSSRYIKLTLTPMLISE